MADRAYPHRSVPDCFGRPCDGCLWHDECAEERARRQPSEMAGLSERLREDAAVRELVDAVSSSDVRRRFESGCPGTYSR